jgi:hypothetical protein
MKLNDLGKQVAANAKSAKRQPFTKLLLGKGAEHYEINITSESKRTWNTIGCDRQWLAFSLKHGASRTMKETIKGIADTKGTFAPNGYADLLKAISED